AFAPTNDNARPFSNAKAGHWPGFRESSQSLRLPSIMGEGFVRFGHLVGVFFFLYRSAGVVEGVEEFVGELIGHSLARTASRGVDKPAHREGLAAGIANLDGTW